MKKQSLDEQLKQEYDRWNHLYTYGGQDPNWPDGYNMYLVRNHIIHIKKDMEEAGHLTETYYRELPPEVDRDYMARADEIRKNAKKSLEIYKRDKDYLYLLDTIGLLNKRQINDTCIQNVIGYCRGLEIYINNNNLVAMRRHEDPERYVKSFSECRKRVENILGEKPRVEFSENSKQLSGQMNILDFLTI